MSIIMARGMVDSVNESSLKKWNEVTDMELTVRVLRLLPFLQYSAQDGSIKPRLVSAEEGDIIRKLEDKGLVEWSASGRFNFTSREFARAIADVLFDTYSGTGQA
jgi:hypothetical protein